MLEALASGSSADPAVLVHHALGARDSSRILRHATSAGHAAIRSGAHTQAAASEDGVVNVFNGKAERVIQLRDVRGDLNIT